MEYNKVIAVTGLPGLYELLSSKSDGAIVRSLEDKNTRFVSSRIHNFSHLESIEIYTVRENTNLVDVLKAMESSSEKLPDEKDGGALKAYFGKVYPDLDFDRVYASDLKKMVKWFSVLKANNVEIKLTEPTQEAGTGAEETAVEEDGPQKVKKEKKKAAEEPEKAKAEKAKAKEADAAEEKPKAKKAAPKKKPDTQEKKAPAEKPKKAAAKKKAK